MTMIDEDDFENNIEENQEIEVDINNIKEEFSLDRTNLEKEIEHIKLIEQKLNCLIYDLESANTHIQTLLQTEKDPQKKKNLYTAVSYNIERLTNLYGVLRQYQDTKHKYLSTISDLTVKKNKLVYVDLNKDKKGMDDSYVLFNKLIGVLNSEQSVIVEETNKNLNEIDEYKM